MRHFRKKAIAICLASALTVLGAFSAENYKNSLVSLRINKGSNGIVSLTAYTRENLSQPLTTEKLDDNDYSIILHVICNYIMIFYQIHTFYNKFLSKFIKLKLIY